MKHAFMAIVVASTFAVGLAVQASPQYPPSSQPEKKKSTSKSTSDAGRAVTLTGCLREGDTPGTFALSNVQWDRGGNRTRGTTGSTTRGTTGKDTVQLTPASGVDLKPHVGHKIQVTGTMGYATATKGRTPGEANTPTATPPSSENPTTASQPESNPNTQLSTGQSHRTKGSHSSGVNAATGPRAVAVKSIKMISETCGN
jgi:hypothetical protein